MFDFEEFEQPPARVIFAAFWNSKKVALFWIAELCYLFYIFISKGNKSPNTEKTARRRCRGGRFQKDAVFKKKAPWKSVIRVIDGEQID